MTAIQINSNTEPTYFTNLTLISGDNDDEKKSLIRRAEVIIDSYVGNHIRFYSKICDNDPEYNETYKNQWTTFPRLEDFNLNENEVRIPFIPEKINLATVLITEILFQNDELAETEQDTAHSMRGLKSISLDDFSATKEDGTEINKNNSLINLLGESVKSREIIELLKIFKNNTMRRK